MGSVSSMLASLAQDFQAKSSPVSTNDESFYLFPVRFRETDLRCVMTLRKYRRLGFIEFSIRELYMVKRSSTAVFVQTSPDIDEVKLTWKILTSPGGLENRGFLTIRRKSMEPSLSETFELSWLLY